MKYLMLATPLMLLFSPAFADDTTSQTTVHEDPAGNVDRATLQSRTDAQGNKIVIKNDVKTDPTGDTAAAKTVEQDTVDTVGDSRKVVTTRTQDPSGAVQVKRYDEENTPPPAR